MTLPRRPSGGLWTGNGDTTPTYDRAPSPRSAPRPAKGMSDEQFDAMLAQWSEDPNGQDVSISIKLECSGFTLKVSDRVVVATMIRAELQRRRAARGAAS